ncbi:GNAT family N-acetyltransferase [Peristeroidobacter agariperforans]|uniref:GNAT family N-acetyltransferase n=1 Tax=Peristeroidobacter agariperforans TaxID=268404 RepID=UPI00101CA528|nr:GNAT family N-acetyltransferase [Peristeroidobacter agariperforans]
MRQFIEHESPRLRLIAWRERHIAPFIAMNSDPEVMRYFPSLISEEQSRASVDYWLSQFGEHGWSNWAVELKDSGEFIGFVGLWIPKQELPFSPCVEIGWRLARRFWGQGYATEGARASLSIGFEQLGLPEIVSYTALMNTPSRAVMERIGMHNTGEDFDHPAVPVGNALRRHCLYKITAEEWAKRR